MNNISGIQKFLNRDSTFFSSENYIESTKTDFQKKEALPACYEWNSEKKVKTVVQKIFSSIFFPLIFLHRSLHNLAGKIAFLPSSQSELFLEQKIEQKRKNLDVNDTFNTEKFRYKRFSIKVDGHLIDAAIMGTEKTLINGKWLLAANGNGEYYEQKLAKSNSEIKCILAKTNANAIVFNYAGVGSSERVPKGVLNREMMERVYQAFLNFLEDEKNGIGAKEVIAYGHSIGGAVVARAMKNHLIEKTTKNEKILPIVIVTSRTFSSMYAAARDLIDSRNTLSRPLGYILGLATRLLGWNMQTAKDLKEVKVPQIIMQTAEVSNLRELTKNEKDLLKHDQIISKDASLASELIQQSETSNITRTFVGMKENHNSGLINEKGIGCYIENEDVNTLSQIINQTLRHQSSFLKLS